MSTIVFNTVLDENVNMFIEKENGNYKLNYQNDSFPSKNLIFESFSYKLIHTQYNKIIYFYDTIKNFNEDQMLHWLNTTY